MEIGLLDILAYKGRPYQVGAITIDREGKGAFTRLLVEARLCHQGTLPTKTRKPFDLEAAKAGKLIVTRDGREVRFVAHVPEAIQSACIIAMINGLSLPERFSSDGCIEGNARTMDLFMAPPPKKTVWVNLYSTVLPEWRMFDSKNGAMQAAENRTIGVKLYATAIPIEIDA